MKKAIKIYLTPEVENALKQKANALFTGRGAVSRYIERIAVEPVCFLDANVKAILGLLNVSPETSPKV
jgi:hypothetical protein